MNRERFLILWFSHVQSVIALEPGEQVRLDPRPDQRGSITVARSHRGAYAVNGVSVGSHASGAINALAILLADLVPYVATLPRCDQWRNTEHDRRRAQLLATVK